jgi:hypothetical protein
MLGPVARDPAQDIDHEALTQALGELTRGERAVSAAALPCFGSTTVCRRKLKVRFRDDPSQVQPLP